MTDDTVKQALAELHDLVRCRCHSAYTGRGLRDPDCECDSAEALKVLADRIEAQAAEIERLRLLVPRPDQTQDELVWRDHMRGVPLAALATEFGVTKERMRYRLKKIAENKLHLTGAKP